MTHFHFGTTERGSVQAPYDTQFDWKITVKGPAYVLQHTSVTFCGYRSTCPTWMVVDGWIRTHSKTCSESMSQLSDRIMIKDILTACMEWGRRAHSNTDTYAHLGIKLLTCNDNAAYMRRLGEASTAKSTRSGRSRLCAILPWKPQRRVRGPGSWRRWDVFAMWSCGPVHWTAVYTCW